MNWITEVSKDEKILATDSCLYFKKENDYKHYFEDLISGNHQRIILDLSRLRAIDTISIMKILILKNRMLKEGRTLQIKGCSDDVFNTFKFLRIDSFINIEK